MEIKIKKLNEKAVIPQYAKEGDAGIDFVATSVTYDKETDSYIYGTGLAIEIPNGYEGLVFPRSSIKNTDLILANSVGVIDSGYRGEIKAVFKPIKKRSIFGFNLSRPKIYKVGERIFQLIIKKSLNVELIEAEALSETSRGIWGFGSTGK